MLFGGLAAVGAGWQWYLDRAQPFEFEPIPGLPGWRRLALGPVTGGATTAVFAGIGEENAPEPLDAERMEAVLYRTRTTGLPVAIFTDVNCPNCASLEAKILRQSDLAITWHDLPLLGPSSEVAARAMIAGELQGSSDFRKRVRATPPGRLHQARLAQMAGEEGLNVIRFLRDMSGLAVKIRLSLTEQAADKLGVWGTPGLTIGRTFVLGNVPSEVIDEIIAFERGRA